MAHINSDSLLLCETCGYSVEELPPDNPCPECGRPIESSDPRHRSGSPWQSRPSVLSWLTTNSLMLWRPGPVLDRLRVTESRSGLLVVNVLLAGLFIAIIWTGVLIGDPARTARNAPGLLRWLAFAASLSAQTLLVAALLWSLTAIEAAGVRFFGRRRGWRITWPIAWQACSHASVGWLIAVVLSVASHIAWLNITYFGLSGWMQRRAGDYVQIGVVFAGFFGGLLIFEVLAYRGVRRCRYANIPAARLASHSDSIQADAAA